jgi:electron transfer flavoprotein beta subunit
VTREVDFGLQKIPVPMPAVFTVDLRLNTPRFASVQNIVKAKKKPVELINIAELGVVTKP